VNERWKWTEWDMKAQNNRGQNGGGGWNDILVRERKDSSPRLHDYSRGRHQLSCHAYTLQNSICAITSSELTRIQPLDVTKDVTKSSTKALSKEKKEFSGILKMKMLC
jgi:hypothetical protein